MSTPGDPQKGRPREDEQTEAAAEEAKQATAGEPAGDAPAEDGPAETGAGQAEGTAADVTGVGKDAAAAALREGSSEPVAEDDAEDDADAEEPVSEAEHPEAEEETATAPARRRGRRGRRGRGGSEEEADPATPEAAPTRRAPARRDGELVVVRAQAKYVRTSARKARLVCDHIRGKSVEEARAILAHTPRAVARDWSKLLESAIANAEHNHELVGDELRIHAVTADEGPTLKRFRPRAMGRATRIRKRTSHLTITLTPKE
jgi:ribosomal protein L22